MKSLLLVMMVTLFATETFAQYRPPRPVPPPPPGRPGPVPPPRPVPPPAGHACIGADLYEGNWLIHRFRWVGDCHEAIQDVRYRGRFCDQGAMYDRYGYYIRQYRDQWECRRWL